MSLSTDEILRRIRAEVPHPMKLKELAKLLDVRNPDYPGFRNGVKELLGNGDLVKLKRGRIGLASELSVVVGKVSITRAGTGFLLRDEAEDILIPERALGTALDGDKILVRLEGEQGGRQTGSVVKVLERARQTLVGVFHIGRHFTFVAPDNNRIHRDIYITPDATKGARDGEKVVVRLNVWDDPYLNPEGEVIERIGLPGTHRVDMLSIMRSFGLAEQFPAEVLSQAESAAARSISEAALTRVDYRATPIYTIDPHDAKDHDDAITVERIPKGFRLGVHIADVSFYVDEGSLLDTEAFNRATSVYLPGMVIPMLPEALSNDVCSLRPHVDRLAHSVIIDFDESGKMRSWRREDTVIHSCAKLSYEDVQAFFDRGERTEQLDGVAENLTTARELARLLMRRRMEEGSIDFDLQEIKVVMDESGETVSLENRVRLESHRLIEEFMLAANRAMALEVFRAGLAMLYRVHDRPDKEKLEDFSLVMKKLGHSFPVSDTMKPVQIARFLEKIADAPEKEFINELMLRSMKKAVYQGMNIGHFGLGFTHYTHFTSPIRRYPDLFIHRLLRKMKAGTYPVAFAKRAGTMIDHVGQHCSEMERIAESAERQAIKLKQVAFMERHLGSEFTGLISGVVPYGFFVRLDHFGAEGMVRLSSIDDDYYAYDEKGFRIVGRRTGQVYRLGDRVRVLIARVDRMRNEIDLRLCVTPIPEVRKQSGPRAEVAFPHKKKRAQLSEKKGKSLAQKRKGTKS